MKTKILQAIQTAGTITYDQLAARAVKRGMSLDELDELMAKVQKDKNVRSTVVNGAIQYKWAPPAVVSRVPSHLLWVADRSNYPTMEHNPDGIELWPEGAFDFMFLSPEDKIQYDADAKGMPAYMLRKKWKRKGLAK